MDDTVRLHDKEFVPYLSAEKIRHRVQALGEEIRASYSGSRPVFVVVLTGAFVFAADLIRACHIPCEVVFVKLSSYEGTRSTGRVRVEMGLDTLPPLEGRDIIVVEDIVDSGKTLSAFLPQLAEAGPRSVALASLLVKPEAIEHPVRVDFTGFEIPPAFVVGYGLDYDELGRDLPAIYQLKN